MANVVSDLILTPALVYRAAVGSSVPADTVAAGTAWGGSWTNWGYTAAPVTFGYEDEQVDVEIEQALAPVKRYKSKENLTIETILAELNMASMEVVTSGTNTATPAGAGQPGKEELTVGGENVLDEYMWGFEGKYIDEDGATFPIRVFVWKATATMNGTLDFAKGAVAGIPMQLKALHDTGKSAGQTLFKISKILEPAT